MKKTVVSIIIFPILILALGCSGNKTIKTYHSNGKLSSIVRYKGELKEGLSEYFFENGLKEVEYPYIGGEIEGTVTRWYYDGKTEYKQEFKNNQLNGITQYFYITGTLSMEKHFKNGIPDGPYKVYWENGVLKIDGAFKDGFYDGKWLYYDEKNIKVGEANFTLGGGMMKGWNKAGVLIREVNYLNNEKHGEERIYTDDGELAEVLVWENGDLIYQSNKK